MLRDRSLAYNLVNWGLWMRSDCSVWWAKRPLLGNLEMTVTQNGNRSGLLIEQAVSHTALTRCVADAGNSTVIATTLIYMSLYITQIGFHCAVKFFLILGGGGWGGGGRRGGGTIGIKYIRFYILFTNRSACHQQRSTFFPEVPLNFVYYRSFTSVK